jgi:hypothetical protein
MGKLIAKSKHLITVGSKEFKRGSKSFRKPVMKGSQGSNVIGSSEQVHVVDALAITGDEGRGSLR